MSPRDAETLAQKLLQMSEEGLASFFNEVMASQRLRRGLGRAGQRLMANKQVFDRNIESILDFVNIPSKRDVRDLKGRLDHLNSQLFNLNIKLDRVLGKGKTTTGTVRRRTRKS